VKSSRNAGAAALLVLVALAGGEILCRQVLGLGDPPLIVRDPAMDYRFAPGRSYLRFGNAITFNEYSMRADAVAARKTDPDELRVLVIGDSVVYGGALTDDRKLATRIAQDRLRDELGRPVWVGNVAAVSWGPGNQLAYLRAFGSFDADIAILVLGSHDLEDVTGFATDLGPDFPESSPVLALEEALVRYLPRYLPWIAPQVAEAPSEPAQARRAQGARELRELLAELAARVPHVVVLHHEERDEAARTADDRASALRGVVEGAGVPFLALRPYLEGGAAEGSPYRDHIHLNDLGQERYARAFACVTLGLLARPATDCR
jgi:hypothetical protein